MAPSWVEMAIRENAVAVMRAAVAADQRLRAAAEWSHVEGQLLVDGSSPGAVLDVAGHTLTAA